MGAQGGDDSDFDGDQHPTGQTTGSVTIGPIAAEQEVDGMAQAGTDSGTDRPAMITAARGMDGRVTAVAAGDGRRPKKSRELRGLETSLNYSSDVQIHRVNAGRHGAVVPSLMSARNVTMTTSQVSMPRTYTIPRPTGPLYTGKNGKRLPMPGTGEPSTDTDDDDNECDPGHSWTLCAAVSSLSTLRRASGLLFATSSIA